MVSKTSILVFSLLHKGNGVEWPDSTTDRCPLGSRFSDDFSEGLPDSRWRVFEKQWGRGNNGLSPHNVRLVDEVVDGSVRKVVELTGNGDNYDGPVRGIAKERGQYFESSERTRVGGGICTRQEFGSGRFEVEMKVETKPGFAPSIWTFHYEEHQPSGRGDELNDVNPNYRPGVRQQVGDYIYSTANSEFDFPELGYNGQFVDGKYNAYRSELEYSSRDIRLPTDVSDGQFHRYTLEWHTHLASTTCNTIVPHPSYPDRLYCHQLGHEDQGYPVVETREGLRVYKGKSADYLVDGILIGSENPRPGDIHVIPSESAELCIALWLPNWAGPAPFETSKAFISRVTIEPFNEGGDICWQTQTFAGQGLVLPSSVSAISEERGNSPIPQLPSFPESSESSQCPLPSFCKCWQSNPTCHGSDLPCSCDIAGPISSPSTPISECSTYCKCWNNPPTCFGDDSACTCN